MIVPFKNKISFFFGKEKFKKKWDYNFETICYSTKVILKNTVFEIVL